MAGFVVRMLDVETRRVMAETDWVFERKEEAETFAQACNLTYAKRGKIQSPSGLYHVPVEEMVFVVAEAERSVAFSGDHGLPLHQNFGSV